MSKSEWFRKYQYTPDALRMEDYDILVRAYKNSRFHCFPRILLGYCMESLSLKKTLIRRYYFSIALSQIAWRDRKYLFAYGVLEQGAKALADTFAIATGLYSNILRHRAGSPVNQVELNRWQKVWAKCSKGDKTALEHYSG